MRAQRPMHGRCHCQHYCDVQKVEKNTTNGSPELIYVPPANALAKENAMMVIVLYANIAVVTMISLLVCIYHAYPAENQTWLPTTPLTVIIIFLARLSRS